MSTYVIFFGGWRATPADMQAWKGSAKAQKSGIDFDAIPWPSGAASDASSAVSAFKNKKTGRYKSVMDDLRAIQWANAQSSNVSKIYIVGHSSGCAIANAVDEDLTDHSDVVLVALDGFAPRPETTRAAEHASLGGQDFADTLLGWRHIEKLPSAQEGNREPAPGLLCRARLHDRVGATLLFG